MSFIYVRRRPESDKVVRSGATRRECVGWESRTLGVGWGERRAGAHYVYMCRNIP